MGYKTLNRRELEDSVWRRKVKAVEALHSPKEVKPDYRGNYLYGNELAETFQICSGCAETYPCTTMTVLNRVGDEIEKDNN